MPEQWYRAEVELREDGSTVWFETFPVVRRTQCGVYLRAPGHVRYNPTNMDPDHCSNLKWVANQGRKRFAYPNRALALESLRARKRKYVTNCERRFNVAQRQRNAADAYRIVTVDQIVEAGQILDEANVPEDRRFVRAAPEGYDHAADAIRYMGTPVRRTAVGHTDGGDIVYEPILPVIPADWINGGPTMETVPVMPVEAFQRGLDRPD